MSSFRYPVDEIRERCDLVEIVSAYVALRKRGKNWVGLCPFHNEKTGSFNVNPERGLWKCFGCGEGGDVFDFVQKIDNASFAEAAERLARKCGIEIDRSEQAARDYSEKERLLRANNVACAFFKSQLGKSRPAQEYLASRGLTESSIEKYKLGYAPDSWDELLGHLVRARVSRADAAKAGLIVARENSEGFYDRFRNRLIFPILDTSDRIIAFGGRAMGDVEPKYLNSPESILFSKSRTLYGLNWARQAVSREDRLIVVEGYMDAITAQEAGFENTVATMGTALTTEHVTVIGRYTRNVVLAFDSDSAGMAAALRSAPIFEQGGFDVRILDIPRGEDPDSLLQGGDTSRFAGLLAEALPIPDYRLKLVLGRYDLATDDGKTAALREAVGVLASIESPLERDRLVKGLARYHPSFGSGTARAEENLRAEVQRLRTRSPARRAGSRGQQKTEEPATARRALGLVEKSERALLGIIIVQGVEPSKVFDRLPPKEFTGESGRALAELVSRQHAELGRIDHDRLRSEADGTAAEELLRDVLVELDDSELNHPLDQLIEAVLNHRKNQRRAKMAALSQKISEGAIRRGDEEYEEYYRLVKETSSPWRR